MRFGNTTIELFISLSRLEFPEFTCSWVTGPPTPLLPLLEAIAGVVSVTHIIKRDNVAVTTI